MYLSVSSINSNESLIFIEPEDQILNPKSAMSRLKKSMKISLTLQSIWLLSLLGFPFILLKDYEYRKIAFLMMMTSAFLGGFGCGIYSKLSIDLINLSQSRRGKF